VRGAGLVMPAGPGRSCRVDAGPLPGRCRGRHPAR